MFQKSFIATLIIIGIMTILSGCGKKGPLYLPDDEKPHRHHQESRS